MPARPPRPAYRIQHLHRPGRHLSPRALDALVAELRVVAATAFDPLPRYQVISGDREALDAAVLTLARREDGSLAGFCAARLLPVRGVGDVLHLGLTCVDPADRGAGLTHVLLSQGLARFLVRHRPIRGAWFTNVASVLSSLGNVALYFEDVHPSPFRVGPPSPVHTAIAHTLAREHRARMHLHADADFDDARFVFEGGNRETVFAKGADDAQYHHRDPELTRWYADLADLDGGDAVLQVGRVSLAGFARYTSRRVGAKVPGVRRWVRLPTVLPLTPERA
ncbi:MAG: hypothetical protein H6733_00220 [Alphaproteobacteria bacterium]|nr:hypothetical protein [Alphaproteobacteria bacterium]